MNHKLVQYKKDYNQMIQKYIWFKMEFQNQDLELCKEVPKIHIKQSNWIKKAKDILE